MRRLPLISAVLGIGVAAWLGLRFALPALLVPRLQERVRAPVTVERVTIAWPPAIAFREVRVHGQSPLRRAQEIRVGTRGIVLRRAELRIGEHKPATTMGRRTPSGAAPIRALPKVTLENSRVVALVGGMTIEAEGVWAHPKAGGWRIRARGLRIGHGQATLRTGSAAADFTEKRALKRAALTEAVVEAHGLRVGPMLIRVADAWDPDGPRLEIKLPKDEARVDGEYVEGWISGTIEARIPPGGPAARVSADLAARDLVVKHATLAEDPVGPTRLALSVAADWQRGGVSFERLDLSSGALRAEARGHWNARGANVDVHLKRAECEDAFASLPESLVPSLAGLRLGGEIEARLGFRFEYARVNDAELSIEFPRMCEVLGEPPGANASDVGEHVAVLRSYGRHVPNAFRVAEDLRFFRHSGFDVEQIRRALIHNLRVRALSRGASTISQQVVKNVFLGHERTLSRKLQEAVLTWRMEQVVPKRRILEAYLDLVELGPNVRGVEAAARTYFGRAAKDLTPLQAVHLAALAPAPVSLSRQHEKGITPEWRSRLDGLLDSMRRRRMLTPAEFVRARAERLELENHAPLARR